MTRDDAGEVEERTFAVDLLTRVEGEGAFTLKVAGGEVVDARLKIFEAPRFFEAFLRERSMHEVIDVVARICGICPIAYQMSAARALERALGVEPTAPLLALRRLIYCGEWIESHALHVFMLHAPDFLGYPSAVEMAADHRALVERGLRMKKTGNALIELLGGRAIHPVSPRIGGFSKAPSRRRLRELRDDLARSVDEARETVRWAATLDAPSFDVDYTFVSLSGERGYPLESGETILVSGRAPVALDDWGDASPEMQVPHSTALHARLADGTAFLCGPMARLHHHAERLHPAAAEVMAEVGLERSVTNPYRSIVVRAVELVHAFAEALDLVEAYEEPEAPYVDAAPRAAVGCGATEAPRGLLWHRYELDAEGLVRDARIVPPTSQNQARIEEDLVALAPTLLALPHEEATHRCEQLIRAYDPCISCATHFLDLRIEREGV
ncbi:MAG: nickel-dependent hydrogenase large subunit [Myxococcales bacterium]|nr:nickel-dependent hydrogenase large subunit [Myxococcales bacterium]